MMKAVLLFFALTASAPAALTRVQDKECHAISAAASCVMPGNVTAGNLSIVTSASVGGGWYCPALPTDTRGTVYALTIGATNTSGDNEVVCIWHGVYSSSGANTITHTAGAVETMHVFEFSGFLGSVTVKGTNTSTPSDVTTTSAGPITTDAANNVLVCVAGDNKAEAPRLFNSATPADSSYFDGPFCSGAGGACGLFDYEQNSAFLFKVVPAGSYTCTFGLVTNGRRNAVAGAAISYTPRASSSGHPYVM